MNEFSQYKNSLFITFVSLYIVFCTIEYFIPNIFRFYIHDSIFIIPIIFFGTWVAISSQTPIEELPTPKNLHKWGIIITLQIMILLLFLKYIFPFHEIEKNILAGITFIGIFFIQTTILFSKETSIVIIKQKLLWGSIITLLIISILIIWAIMDPFFISKIKI